MSKKITMAMVMAAGLGTRMRPFTNTLPKPLVRVAGKPLLDHALDRLADAGVQRAVVNVHYKAEMISRHLQQRKCPKIHISDETDRLLDTGGGVARALPHLGAAPFFVHNTDALWLEGAIPALTMMAARFDPGQMDCLMLLAATVTSLGISGLGDFTMDANGRLARRAPARVTPFVYAGVCLMAPELFREAPARQRFSMNLLWDKALENRRLFGLLHEGVWMHVGDAVAVAEAEKLISGK